MSILERTPQAGSTEPRAIIDIGSNTVRLVVFGGPPRAPSVLLNEKVTAKLGKGVAESGRLSDKSMGTALAALARYRTLLTINAVRRIDVVATAAARDASNGAEFLDKVRALGFAPRLLSGEEEAMASAHGVLGAFPGARGIVADLGGGSLELVDIADDACSHGTSMPLGTLRLPALRAQGGRDFAAHVAAALDSADWRAEIGTTLYLVGGSLRSLARYMMRRLLWPVDDPHGFDVDAGTAVKFCRTLSREDPASLAQEPGISASRLASLPHAAALLAELVTNLQPVRIVFSSWGLREGILMETLEPAARAQHPLIAGVSAFASELGTSPALAAMVAGWTAAANLPSSDRRERLRLAATMLCLAAVRVEPNLRAEYTRDWALRKRWTGIDAQGRAMLAVALAASTGAAPPPGVERIASPDAVREAQAWGLATRLCRRFSAGSTEALSKSALRVAGDRLVLQTEAETAPLVHDAIRRDLKSLATHLGLTPAEECAQR